MRPPVEARISLGDARQVVSTYAVKASEIATSRRVSAQRSVERFQFGFHKARRRNALAEASKTEQMTSRFGLAVAEVIRDDLQFDLVPYMGSSRFSERSYRIRGSRDTGRVDGDGQPIRVPVEYGLSVTATSNGMGGEMPNYKYYGSIGQVGEEGYIKFSKGEAEENARRVLPAVKAIHEIMTRENVRAPLVGEGKLVKVSGGRRTVIARETVVIDHVGWADLPVPSQK